MKRIPLFLALVCMANIVFAQWSVVPSNNNNIYNTSITGFVGIGTSNPTAPLDINGMTHTNSLFVSDVQHAGDISVWLRGASNGSANMVLQALGGNSQAYWITGADGMLKIGANGGVEPAAGAININYLGQVGIGTTTPGAFMEVRSPGALGATTGNNLEIGRMSAMTGNYSQLKFLVNRFANGSDWLSASTRIQAATDGTNQGYIDFNPPNGLTAVAFGSGANELMRINSNGNIGIGTTNPGAYKLAVEGILGARSVKVTTIPWADYVFDEGYRLRPLGEIEKFILQYKHLPEVPTAAEVAKNGVDLGENQALLLKKVEELTLYLIEQQKQLQLQQKQIDALTQANKGK